MKGFKTEIENAAITNSNFRKVIYTAPNCQLVLMSLRPSEEIGMETHTGNDQFFRVEKGHGRCLIDGHEYLLSDGDAVVVPKGARHNIVNLSETEDLKLYTIYSPPHHLDGIVCETKTDAEARHEEFDGKTTEQSPGDGLSSIAMIAAGLVSAKSKRIVRKFKKGGEQIAKYESKIAKLKNRMSKFLLAK